LIQVFYYEGDGGTGKSSLINYLVSVWMKSPVCVQYAPVGTKEIPGTRCFDGPYELFDPATKYTVFELYDGMGFTERVTSDDYEDILIKREITGIAKGDIKPGFSRYGKRGVFVPVEKSDFNGVDLVVIVAPFAEEDEKSRIQWCIQVRTLLDENFVPSLIILTHAGNKTEHPLLGSAVPHICVDSPKGTQAISNKKTVIEILMKFALLIETRLEVELNHSFAGKAQDMKEKVTLAQKKLERNINYNWILYAIVLVLLFYIFFK